MFCPRNPHPLCPEVPVAVVATTKTTKVSKVVAVATTKQAILKELSIKFKKSKIFVVVATILKQQLKFPSKTTKVATIAATKRGHFEAAFN